MDRVSKAERQLLLNMQRKKTHFDEIKDMTVSGLAAWLSHLVGCPLNGLLYRSPLGKCKKHCTARECWEVWLKSSAEDEEKDD